MKIRTILSAVSLFAITAPAMAQVAAPTWQPGETAVNSEGIKYRSGTSPLGNEYQYFNDGSGRIRIPGDTDILGGWSINCKFDAITDVQSCHMNAYRNNLLVMLDSEGGVTEVCVVGHDFPGRKGAIRVDANTAFITGTDGCVRSPQLGIQLLKGTKVTTRGIKWPRDYPVDEVADIGPFMDALELTRYIREHMREFEF